MRFRVFGGVGAEIDGQPLDLGPSRQRLVLAVLLAEANRRVSTDQLIDRVWPEQPPASSRDTLYGYLSRLRSVLAADPDVAIVRDSPGYRLIVDESTVDLQYYRSLVRQARSTEDDRTALTLFEQALALWQGEPFDGLDTPWLAALRATLAEEHHAVLLDHVDVALRCGRHADLLPDLFARVADHPLDERLVGQLMVALWRVGRPADALTRYQRVRAALIQELGAYPGPALKAIHDQILTGEDQSVEKAVPRQLPAAPAWFTGRATELAALDRMLHNGSTVVISAIAGAGGIGKTWLALHWAHRHLDRFPDGQLFLDLRGFAPTGEPLSPQGAVRSLLEGLGVSPDRIPADPDAQVALYRDSTAGRRMLVVLDNAADAAQVAPLLPAGPPGAVLVTSRTYLADLSTAAHVPVGILTETEARHLLSTRLGADRVTTEPEAVDTLLACCGGFPLALSIVIGRVLAYPEFPLSVFAAELADHAGGLGALDAGDTVASVPAVLSWSVRALTDEQVRVFALLGIAPGPDIGVPAAAGLTALSEPELRKVLRELENASLVQQRTPGRYRMHDLIRRYANEIVYDRMSEEDIRAALRRILDCYTQTAYLADRLLDPHAQPFPLAAPAPGVPVEPLADVPAALAWLGTEYAALVAAQRIAVDHGWHATVWHLAWALDTYQVRRGHRRDRLAMWRAGLAAAEHLTEPATRITAHRNLGYAYAELDRDEEATSQFDQALALARQHNDTSGQAHTHYVLAWVWERRGDDRQALAHATHARDLYRELDRPTWEADALNQMGWYAGRLGEYDAARAHCGEALALHRKHDHPSGEAATLDSLGYIAHHSGRHRQAIEYYQQSLTMLRDLGYAPHAVDSLAALGRAHHALGEHDQARAFWREALTGYREQGRDTDAERVQRELDELTAGAS